ncbi:MULTISPECIES: hypothetical protein [unclassified Agarivorans]|uniref:hypothetical protein n=1 Tax=unclassified Agarivorans TaxID=2636026 RepID=UPI0026E328B6|nr:MULTISPECIES: hypothetical protein [unclassified Agarivorans]MDO6685263.1 hypothetical protein [Agarivorans sp. 3_MG-2023]MDO6715565.1 hypothetical protein [Agarivorans sp. 2_MG-2023]
MDFGKHKETRHLKPLQVPNKEKLLLDVSNIEDSFTGRADASVANTFIFEASHLIVNSLALFEQGYFDCAFYSLRQSLEVAMTMMYLFDSEEVVRKRELEKWRGEQHFPMYAGMAKYLESNESQFKDIKNKLSEFFEEAEKVKKRLNKYVHKQGFDKFYASRNHALTRIKGKFDDEAFTNEFIEYVESCIGTVAVMRLAIDPMPVLLNDEEIYARTVDTMTYPYSDKFINKYIGVDAIEKYKLTSMYSQHYDCFMQEEKQNEAVSWIFKDKFIDIKRADEILAQGHLLSQVELLGVIALQNIESVTKFYTCGGFIMYFSNRDTLRQKLEWNTRQFDNFLATKPSSNQPFDEVFISTFNLPEGEIFLEHNHPITGNDIYNIEHLIRSFK